MGHRLLSARFSGAAVAVLLLGRSAEAVQGVPPQAFRLPASLACAGTTAVVEGQPWGYVVWNANDTSWLDAHDVAVWLKPAGGAFELQGVMTLMTDPQAIRVWLPRAAALGDDLAVAQFLAGQLLVQWKAAEPLPDTLADRLSMLAGRARLIGESAAALRQMGNSRPVFRFLTGTAWAGPLGVANGQEAVIELRERDRTTGAEGGVVGRVVLTAGHVDALAAPGAPVQVPPTFLKALPEPSDAPLFAPGELTVSNLDRLPDLGVALRWAVPEALRRQVLLTRGFMVWCLPEGSAPPADGAALDAQARAAGKLPTQPGAVRALARVPGPATKLFSETGSGQSGPDVADFTLDPATFFMLDDDARYDTAQNNPTQVVGTAYAEGTALNYYVAATDLLGRYGPLSVAGSGVATHTVPPEVPDVLRVESIMKPDIGNGLPAQRLRVVWKPNANRDGRVATTHYLVFRDRTVNSEPEPLSLNRSTRPEETRELIYLGVVDQPGEPGDELSFDDDALAPVADDYGRPYFYCVRAAHLGPFGYNLSRPSPAVVGTLRDREGPPPPTGFTAGDCPRAGIAFDGDPVPDGAAAVPPEQAVLRVVLRRGTADGQWKHVDWVQLEADVEGGVTNSPRLYFGRTDVVWFDFIVPEGFGWRLQAVAGTPMGRLSHPVVRKDEETFRLDRSTRYVLSGRVLGAPAIDMAPPGQALSEFWTPYFTRNGEPTAASFTPSEPIPGTLSGTYGPWVASGRHATLLVQSGSHGVWGNRATSLLTPVTNGFHFSGVMPLMAVAWRAWEVVDPAGAPDPIDCPHTAYPEGAPKIQPIHVVMNIPAGAREYRLYRRIDAGDLVLLAQGTGIWDDGDVALVKDDGLLPPAGGTIRYYGQTFDRNGNPSPLVLLDEKIGEAKLPVPSLGKPTSAGDATHPRMRIKAICPSAGVERMAIDVTPNLPLALDFPAELVAQTVEPKLVFGASKPALFSQTLTTAASRFAGTNATMILDVEVPVLAGEDYTVTVRALGFADGDEGDESATQPFTWTPPIEEGEVPWPARPVPQVVNWNSQLRAFQTGATNFTLVAGRTLTMHTEYAYPVAVPIGFVALKRPQPYGIDDASNWEVINGVLGVSGIPRFGEIPPPADLFHSFLYFKTVSAAGGSGVYMPDLTQTLFPFVLYQRQTARRLGDAVIPTPDTDITQVSPMIGRIAWTPEAGAEPRFALLVDPFVGALVTGTAPHGSAQLCLFDNTPVAVGATYQYYLMHFDSAFEPDQIINAGQVTITEQLLQ